MKIFFTISTKILSHLWEIFSSVIYFTEKRKTKPNLKQNLKFVTLVSQQVGKYL